MSQKSKSDIIPSIGDTSKTDTKDKKRSKTDINDLTKEYKKPRLKQLTFDTKPAEEATIFRSSSKKSTPQCLPEDMARIKERLELVITRQDTAQACIERLLAIFTREAQEDSSLEEGVIKD